jgi:hypothetical protein
VPTIDEWIARWNAGGPALAEMKPDRYRDLAEAHVPMRVIASDARRVVVEKP